jgi:hypothetical protein
VDCGQLNGNGAMKVGNFRKARPNWRLWGELSLTGQNAVPSLEISTP